MPERIKVLHESKNGLSILGLSLEKVGKVTFPGQKAPDGRVWEGLQGEFHLQQGWEAPSDGELIAFRRLVEGMHPKVEVTWQWKNEASSLQEHIEWLTRDILSKPKLRLLNIWVRHRSDAVVQASLVAKAQKDLMSN